MAQDEATSRGMLLADGTILRRYTAPTKGKFWDFGVIGVAASTDPNVWDFPKNTAIVMIVHSVERPPHGAIIHRAVVNDHDPFEESIAIAVKDIVQSVSLELALVWPDFTSWMAHPGDLPTSSRVCPGLYK